VDGVRGLLLDVEVLDSVDETPEEASAEMIPEKAPDSEDVGSKVEVSFDPGEVSWAPEEESDETAVVEDGSTTSPFFVSIVLSKV
jgi:hypothetical protein